MDAIRQFEGAMADGGLGAVAARARRGSASTR